MSDRIDIGEDKNLFAGGGLLTRTPIMSSVLMDDLARTPDDAITEARTAAWPNWINSDPLILGHQDEEGKTYLFYIAENIRNKVVVLFLWDYTLLPCLRVLRYIKEWHRRYSTAGLITIGVHSPRFEFGKEKRYIESAVRDMGITFPVVLDNEFNIWKSLENRFWPRRVLIGSKGGIEEDLLGEDGFAEFEASLQKQLRELSPGLACPPLLKPIYEVNRDGIEVFLGFKRRPRLGNSQTPRKENEEVSFEDESHGTYVPSTPYFDGPWMVTGESMYPAPVNVKNPYKGEYKVTVNCGANRLYVVACARPKNPGDISQILRVQVTLNGKPIVEDFRGGDVAMAENRKTFLVLRDPRIYEIARNFEGGVNEIRLTVDPDASDTMELFAFYFG